MALLLVYALLALGVSFLCSIMEAVLLSITPTYAAAAAERGGRTARLIEHYRHDINRPLAAILSLNTIAHTVGAVGVGAQAAHLFGDAALGIVSALLTFLILVLSEIVPKTLGALYWRQLTPAVVRALAAVIPCMWPLVKLAELITSLLGRTSPDLGMGRDEISAIADLGEQAGVLESHESSMLKDLLRTEGLRAADVMTPRVMIFALDEKLTVEEALALYPDVRYSRIPVYAQHPEEVTGYILKDSLYLHAARGMVKTPLVELRRDILAVQEQMAVIDVLSQLLEGRNHIALVVDEYGGVSGLVTVEDVVETFIGMEIQDESDAIRDLQAHARERWRRRARARGIVLDD